MEFSIAKHHGIAPLHHGIAQPGTLSKLGHHLNKVFKSVSTGGFRNKLKAENESFLHDLTADSSQVSKFSENAVPQ